MSFYFEEDVDHSLILGKRVAIVGYGNQGRAQALNLRDSGVEVVVGAREGGSSWAQAVTDGFSPLNAPEACRGVEFVMLTLADTAMPAIYEAEIREYLEEDALLLFAHGYCIHFGSVVPRVATGLVSPKGPGKSLRERFLGGSGLPALFAASSPEVRSKVMAYAWGIGCARQGLLETTFEEETVTDLFGEQAVLCGGIPELIKAGFQTLVDAGYSPEVAYFECMHEAKLITDLLMERGFEGMRSAISDTAEWGGYLSGSRLIDAKAREEMKKILREIQGGAFAETLKAEAAEGFEKLKRLRSEEARSLIEKTWQETHNPTKRT